MGPEKEHETKVGSCFKIWYWIFLTVILLVFLSEHFETKRLSLFFWFTVEMSFCTAKVKEMDEIPIIFRKVPEPTVLKQSRKVNFLENSRREVLQYFYINCT